jgi:hypothetical protein
LLTLLTAATGLLGVRLNSRMLLGVYGSLLAVMLLGQAAVAIACFADDAWSKHLPPDETGEAKKVGLCFLWPAQVFLLASTGVRDGEYPKVNMIYTSVVRLP